jgi:hypothetical protein
MAFTEVRPPLVSGKLLRLAGQLLRQRTEKQFDDFVPYLMIVIAFSIVFFVEWIQKIAGENPNPGFWMILSILVTCYGGVRAFRLYPQIRNAPLGGRGERRLAEVLGRIRSKGFIVFHDLPGTESNIDHVVVGPTGIYAIEAKAWNVIGSGTIDYANESEVILGGRITDGRVLRQARSSALSINLQLREHLLESYCVKPLLVLLRGWRVRQRAGDFSVAVITADQLEEYFEGGQPELTRQDIAQICSELEGSARS